MRRKHLGLLPNRDRTCGSGGDLPTVSTDINEGSRLTLYKGTLVQVPNFRWYHPHKCETFETIYDVWTRKEHVSVTNW